MLRRLQRGLQMLPARLGMAVGTEQDRQVCEVFKQLGSWRKLYRDTLLRQCPLRSLHSLLTLKPSTGPSFQPSSKITYSCPLSRRTPDPMFKSYQDKVILKAKAN